MAVCPPNGAQRNGLAQRLGSSSPALIDAVEAMEEHIAYPLKRSDLARVAKVTPRQLSRLFRFTIGDNAMGNYCKLRLDAGRHLIVSTSMSINEIARAKEFSSSRSFARHFAAHFGRPPSSLLR